MVGPRIRTVALFLYAALYAAFHPVERWGPRESTRRLVHRRHVLLRAAMPGTDTDRLDRTLAESTTMRPTRTRTTCSVIFLLLLAAAPARAEKVPGFPPQGRSIAGNQLGQTDSGFFTAQFKTAIAMVADRADKNGRSSLKPGSMYALFLHNPGSSGMGKFRGKFVEAKSRGHRGGAKSERQMGSEGSAASDAGRRPRPESEAGCPSLRRGFCSRRAFWSLAF